jgi:hypothetical protein
MLAFFNKEFRDSKHGEQLQQLLTELAKRLPVNNNSITSREIGGFMFDDSLVWFRNLGFLEDADFINAVGDYKGDPIVMTKIWRLWIVASTLASTWGITGNAMDIGTYDGKSIEIALSYCRSRLGELDFLNKMVCLYDAFENPPLEARKSNHSATLHEEVRVRLDRFRIVEVNKGFVPEVLELDPTLKVSWAQIDLNSAEFDKSAFMRILPHLSEGSVVVFDDYGFLRYKDTQLGLDQLTREMSLNPIIELPTGQGLYFHRVTK